MNVTLNGVSQKLYRYDTGVADGDIIEADAVGLPVIDGSQLTGIAAGVGGVYGINVEVLGAGKTLTPGTDEIYQYLDEGGANRIITLDTASATAGDRFVIRHNGVMGDAFYLQVNQAAVILDYIYAGAIKHFIFDGTNWVAGEIGSGENDTKRQNISIGMSADGANNGVAVGYYADARTSGVAVGYHADGLEYGVGVGYNADGRNYGTALGFETDTNGFKYSIALGYYSETERTGETSVNINGDDSDQENNVVQGRWEREIAGGAGATEIFCAGQANQRFLIRANSVLAFEMIIVARDNVANEVARYSVHDGLIKRDGANNTVMVNCTVVVDYEDDAGWDCAVTADDGNEALIITVTGDGANITQWAAVMNGVETHF